MPTRKVLRRLAAASAAGAVVATLAFAAPAHAEDAVAVNISGLASTLNAGSRGDGFSVRMQNRTKTEIFPIRKTFVIRLEGLTAESVRITRGNLPLPASGSGEVRVIDPLPVRLGPDGKNGDSQSTSYGIQFAEGAPAGRASVTFEAYIGQNLLGSDSASVTVKSGQGAATPTKSPVATGPGVILTFETAAPVSIAPITENQGLASGGGIPIAFYLIGALLVGVGGVILWLLFRPGHALVEGPAAGDEPPPPSLGYPTPRHAAPDMRPTAVFPAVPRNPNPAPPAFDPWATPAGPPDPTRELRPPRP